MSMFMIEVDDVKLCFTVIGADSNCYAELHPLSFWYEIPKAHLYFDFNGQKYSSLAQAVAANLWCPPAVDFPAKLANADIQKALKKAGVIAAQMNQAGLLQWVQSAKTLKDSVKRAFELNTILYDDLQRPALEQLLPHLIQSYVQVNKYLLPLLKATLDTCLVFDTFSGDTLSEELGCGVAGLGLNLLGNAWMIVRQGETAPADLYAAFKTWRLTINDKKTPLRNLETVTEFLPPATPRTNPYLMHLIQATELLPASGKKTKEIDSRREHVFQWLLVQTMMLFVAEKNPFFRALYITNDELTLVREGQSPPVTSADPEDVPLPRSIVTTPLLQTLQNLNTKKRAPESVCVFQTFIDGKSPINIMDFATKELAYSSSYLTSMNGYLSGNLSEIKVLVSKDTLVVRDHQFTLLDPSDRYKVTVITALCPHGATAELLAKALEMQCLAAAHIQAQHIVIDDLNVVRSAIKHPGRIVQMYSNIMDSLLDNSFLSLTIVVPMGELVPAFNQSNLPKEYPKNFPIDAKVAPLKMVMQVNKKNPTDFLGLNAASIDPDVYVFCDATATSMYFCFSDLNETNDYFNRLRDEHGFNDPAILKKRSSTTLQPVPHEMNRVNWCHSHPFALELSITKDQYEKLADFMKSNREFWRQFTQPLIQLIKLRKSCEEGPPKKLIERGASTGTRTQYYQAMLGLCDELEQVTDGVAEDLMKTLRNKVAELNQLHHAYLTPPESNNLANGEPENPKDLLHVKKLLTAFTDRADSLDSLNQQEHESEPLQARLN